MQCTDRRDQCCACFTPPPAAAGEARQRLLLQPPGAAAAGWQLLQRQPGTAGWTQCWQQRSAAGLAWMPAEPPAWCRQMPSQPALSARHPSRRVLQPMGLLRLRSRLLPLPVALAAAAAAAAAGVLQCTAAGAQCAAPATTAKAEVGCDAAYERRLLGNLAGSGGAGRCTKHPCTAPPSSL